MWSRRHAPPGEVASTVTWGWFTVTIGGSWSHTMTVWTSSL